jgi:hypothetical protein
MLAILACLGVVGAIERQSLPVEEAVMAAASGKVEARLSDAIRDDCLEQHGMQFIAWRSDAKDRHWTYACVNAWLRPEQLVGL